MVFYATHIKKALNVNPNARKYDIKFVEPGLHLTRMLSPYGKFFSPVVFDVLSPLVHGFFVGTHQIHNAIIHVLYPHLYSFLTLIQSTNLNRIVTYHHIPETISPKIIDRKIDLNRLSVSSKASDSYKESFSTSGIDSTWELYDSMVHMVATRFTDHIVSVSSLTREEILNLYKNVKAETVHVVHPAPSDKITFLERNYRSKLSRRTKVIGYFGSLEKRKNVLLLPFIGYSLKKLAKTDVTFEFHIWGKGPYESRLRNLVKLLGIQDFFKIHPIGRLSEEQKNVVLNDFDLLVLPSFKEGFGLPIVEAAKVKVPCVVFSWSKIPKEIKDMCIPANTVTHMTQIIFDILTKAEKLACLGENACDKAQEYTWQNTATKLSSLYEQVLTSG